MNSSRDDDLKKDVKLEIWYCLSALLLLLLVLLFWKASHPNEEDRHQRLQRSASNWLCELQLQLSSLLSTLFGSLWILCSKKMGLGCVVEKYSTNQNTSVTPRRKADEGGINQKGKEKDLVACVWGHVFAWWYAHWDGWAFHKPSYNLDNYTHTASPPLFSQKGETPNTCTVKKGTRQFSSHQTENRPGKGTRG